MKHNLWINGVLLGIGVALAAAFSTPSQGTNKVEEAAFLRDPLVVLRALDRLHPELSAKEVELVFKARLSKNKKHLAKALATQLVKSAKHYNISSSMILAVIHAESSFQFKARSHKGAVGLMQLLPSTAKYIAKREKISGYHSRKDLHNPTLNLELGIAYLAYLKAKFPNSIHYVAAYNLGPTTVGRRLASADEFELGAIEPYVTKIHREASRLKRERSELTQVVMN